MLKKKKTPVKKVIKKAEKKLSTKNTVNKKTVPKKKTTKKNISNKKVVKKKITNKKAAVNMSSPKKKVNSKKPTNKRLDNDDSVNKVAANISNSSEINSTEIDHADKINTSLLPRSEVVEYKKPVPIALSIDEIEEMMAAKKTDEVQEEDVIPNSVVNKPKVKVTKKRLVEKKPNKKRVLGAASLSDILGFNPNKKKKESKIREGEVPKKWSKYYKLLIELRTHVSDELSLHTSETLGHSSREDCGDLSNFGSHQADAGTDTFDRDFALSLVSSEHDALNEIEEAIQRIKDGTFGVCEVTNKRIPAARLAAVPFTRFSVEGQVEHEKNKGNRSKRTDTPSIFGDVSDAPKLVTNDDDE